MEDVNFAVTSLLHGSFSQPALISINKKRF